MKKLIGTLLVWGAFMSPAYAHHRPTHHRHYVSHPVRTHGDLITVSTAAGMSITVSPSFAPKIEGFIHDLVLEGYHPGQIHCFASGGHVVHSLHYSGNACDFDQSGWGKTARMMYHVQALADKWGLRNGCEFRDCGHIDAGFSGTRLAQYRPRHYARRYVHRYARHRYRHYAHA